jgi:hypothetical protein
MNRIIITTLLLFAILLASASGQSNNNIFVGLQPAVTVEPFYEDGELDINVLPLIYETQIGSRTTIRFAPIVNYHIGGETEGISDVAVFAVLPVFFNKVESVESKPYGFYIGPVLGFGRNLINDHYTTTVAIEPGYMFETDESFTITLGIQFGGSYFGYDSKPNKWLFHWGPKITFGFWL